MGIASAHVVDGENGVVVIEGASADPAGADGALIRLGLIPDPAGELAKTAEELRAIDVAVATLQALRKELGLDPQRLSSDVIHVLDEQAFGKRWGWNTRACTQFGHVYLARRSLFLYFLQDLTHEIVHLAAFKAVVTTARDARDAVTYVRSGFSPLDGRPASTRWRFVGFNEGVTELIAMDLRVRMSDAARRSLNEELSHVFLGECLYPPFVLLVDGVIRTLARGRDEHAARGRDEHAARRALFADYFTRSAGSLRALARLAPGAAGALAAVETGRDALAAAERLGFDKEAASIRRILARRRRR